MADLDAVVELILACDMADTGERGTSPDDVLTDWRRPGFRLDADALLLVTPAGRAVAYSDVWRRSAEIIISPALVVHPEYRGLGLEQYVFGWAEARAQELYAASPGEVKTVSGIARNPSATVALYERRSFLPAKYTWRMQIELDPAPHEPAWPAGYVLRPFDPTADAYPLYRLIEDAFSVFPGRQPVSYELWRTWIVERSDFDPGLVAIVAHGAEIAGAAVCFDYAEDDLGWVRQLAVAEPHRRQGMALALLRHAFGVFALRGRRHAGLAVDATNPTGATILYERAGMQAVEEFVTYRRDLP